MGLRSLRLPLAACALVLFALPLGSACSAPEEATPGAEDVGETAAAITSADVLSRAQQWVDAKLKYCQSPNHKPDGDSACSSVCERTDNAQWDPYRSDCSGFVSWAWGLPAPGHVTGTFAPYDNSVSKEITGADLQPGDALNNSDHIVLFIKWITKGSEAVFQEEPGCSVSIPYAHQFNSSVSFEASNMVHLGYEGASFHPIRFNSIVQKAPDWAATYVKQSWPLASAAPIQLVVGEKKTGSIDLKNTGGQTWAAGNVRLAPIPRDKASAFAAGSWLSKTRVSSNAAAVKPGETAHFEWDLEASAPGDAKPFFGLVAEGHAWFADSGGPPDNDIQLNIHAVAAPKGAGGAGGAKDTGAAGKSSGSAGAKSTPPAEGGAAGAEGDDSGEAGAEGDDSGEAGAPATETGGASAAGHGGTTPPPKGEGGETGEGGTTSTVGGHGTTATGGSHEGGSSAASDPTLAVAPEQDATGCNVGGEDEGASGAFGLLIGAGLLLRSRRRRA